MYQSFKVIDLKSNFERRREKSKRAPLVTAGRKSATLQEKLFKGKRESNITILLKICLASLAPQTQKHIHLIHKLNTIKIHIFMNIFFS